MIIQFRDLGDLYQLVKGVVSHLRHNEISKQFRLLDHFIQPARFPICVGVHFQWLRSDCLPFEALSHLFQVSVEPGFGFLYCGVYSVLVGLESVAPETAG